MRFLLGVLIILTACQPSSVTGETAVVEKTAELSASDSNNQKGQQSMPQAMNGHLDDSGKLSLSIENWTVEISAANCRNETDTVVFCDGQVQIALRKTDNSMEQTFGLESLYLDRNATFYNGTLDASYKMRGHSLVLSDVNGDGHDDLLAWTGKEGAYGGPSYDIYLYDPASKEFTHSQEFSELTMGYNGLFFIEQGKIKAASSEGCCLHVFDTYEVRVGKPLLVERITEDTNQANAPKRTVERLINGRLQEVKE